MDQLVFLVALHGGAQLSLGDERDGSGLGPRFEVEALAQPVPWFSIGVVGSYYHFSDTLIGDGPGPTVTEHVTSLSTGIRAYVQSDHVFFGAGVLGEWRGDGEFRQTFGPEIVVGGNVAHLGKYRVQVLLAASADRPTFDWVEDFSFQIGVQRVVP
jgi:hypothetical protein